MMFKLRMVVAAVLWLALTGSFLGMLHVPLTKMQFIPALLAANIGVIVAVILVTALFGRIYCAVLCPLGVFQDIVFLFKRKLRKKQVHFSYQPELRPLRYGILAILLLSWLLGIAVLPALLDPYSIYGRMVTNLLSPLWQSGFNNLAAITEGRNLLLLEKYDMVWQGLTALVVAAVYFVVLLILAWRYGRLYCNSICPTGTLLGSISRFSFMKLAIDEGTCVSCGRCEQYCRSSCIDIKNHAIDTSRCILCFQCQAQCPKQAIHFCHVKALPAGEETTGKIMSRRTLLTTSVLAVGTAAAAIAHENANLSLLAQKPAIMPVMPPGAEKPNRFLQQCTACHLCIDNCPNQVLRPAGGEYGPDGFLKPLADYSRGYCDYNCHRCSEVCPNGAIHRLALKDKQHTVIGMASYEIANCLIPQEGVVCGNCALHCPTKAISMDDVRGVKLPHIHPQRCIGCGSCEYHCPAMPKAIKVQGIK